MNTLKRYKRFYDIKAETQRKEEYVDVSGTLRFEHSLHVLKVLDIDVFFNIHFLRFVLIQAAVKCNVNCSMIRTVCPHFLFSEVSCLPYKCM